MTEIAIDGTAASGKGTLAKKLAEKFGCAYLDTGLLYRKVANELLIQKKNNSIEIEAFSCKIARSLDFLKLEDEGLRTEETANLASSIAISPKLREILNLKQKEFVIKSKEKFSGCILDGRDIGTKILPNANFKFFIDASVEIRAKRRLLEKNISFLHESDEKCMLHSLIKEMADRDKIDTNRLVSPLVPANDAHVIDTSFLNADQLFLKVMKIIEGKNKIKF